MKKAIILCTLMLIGTTVFSQGVDFGVKAGVNFASITDASIGDIQYYIDDCSHSAESIKDEINDFFEGFTEKE